MGVENFFGNQFSRQSDSIAFCANAETNILTFLPVKPVLAAAFPPVHPFLTGFSFGALIHLWQQNTVQMRKLFFAFCLLLTITGWSQGKVGNTVPKELLTDDSTAWSFSTLSNLQYVNTQPGAYYGTTTSGGGMIARFKFFPNNRYRFQLLVQVNTYGMRTETWTEVEGSVEFTKDEKGQPVFITSAEKGHYRINKNGTMTRRDVTPEELKRQHSGRYLWEKTMMKDDPKNEYFLTVDLKAHPDADANKPGSIDPSWITKFHIPVSR